VRVNGPPPARLLVVLALVPLLVLGAIACSDTPPRVNLYGDSLSFEAQDELKQQLRGTARLSSAAQGGAALCDALAGIEQDLQRRKPAAAIIQYTGNNITDCMQLAPGEPFEGDELVAKYTADTERAVTMLRERDVLVYLMGSPIAGAPSSIAAINAAFEGIAERWSANGGGVSYVDAGAEVLTANGSYTARLPCLDDETAEMGCSNGTIAVRSPDALHFCPVATGGTEPCPVYSSGARRFAEGMARPLIDELDSGLIPGL
jgi:hypothetical protein